MIYWIHKHRPTVKIVMLTLLQRFDSLWRDCLVHTLIPKTVQISNIKTSYANWNQTKHNPIILHISFFFISLLQIDYSSLVILYSRSAKCGECSIWNVSRWCTKITAHINARQDAGNCWKKYTKYAKPCVAVHVIGPKIRFEVFQAPTDKTTAWKWYQLDFRSFSIF